MVCRRGGFIIQRHNKLCDLEADLLNTVCHDAQVEPVLQEITGEVLTRGTNPAPDALVGFGMGNALPFST